MATSRKQNKSLDWRAIIQGVVGAIILASIFGTWNSVSSIYKTVSGHSMAIESIPTIKADVAKAKEDLTKQNSETSAKVDGTKTELGSKIEHLVTRDEMTNFKTNDDSRLKALETAATQLQIDTAVQKALNQHATPANSPSPGR